MPSSLVDDPDVDPAPSATVGGRAGGGTWPVAPRTVAVGATVLAGLLAMVRLGHKSLWLDEGYSLGHASMAWADFWRVLVEREPNGALHALVLFAWYRVSEAEWWVRLPSAAFAVATVPLLYLLLKRLFDDRAGAFGAVLLALNGFSLRFAQEARTYSLLMLLTTASVLAFVAYAQDHRRRQWWLWVLVTAALPYTHVFGWLAIAVQAVAAVARRGPSRPPRRALIGGFGVIGLVGLPIALALLAGNDEGQATGIPGVTIVRFVGVYARVAGDLGIALLAAVGLLWAWTVVVAIHEVRTRGAVQLDERQWGVVVLVAWLLVPTVLIALGSPIQPLFGARYFVLLVPAASGLTAVGLLTLRRPALRWAAGVVVLALTAGGAVGWYARPAIDDVRTTTEIISADAQPGDAVVFSPWFMKLPFDQYADREPALAADLVPAWPTADWGTFLPDHPDHPDEETLVDAAAYDRVWVVARDDRTPEDDADLDALRELLAGTHVEVRHDDPAGMDVWLFERTATP